MEKSEEYTRSEKLLKAAELFKPYSNSEKEFDVRFRKELKDFKENHDWEYNPRSGKTVDQLFEEAKSEYGPVSERNTGIKFDSWGLDLGSASSGNIKKYAEAINANISDNKATKISNYAKITDPRDFEIHQEEFEHLLKEDTTFFDDSKSDYLLDNDYVNDERNELEESWKYEAEAIEEDFLKHYPEQANSAPEEINISKKQREEKIEKLVEANYPGLSEPKKQAHRIALSEFDSYASNFGSAGGDALEDSLHDYKKSIYSTEAYQNADEKTKADLQLHSDDPRVPRLAPGYVYNQDHIERIRQKESVDPLSGKFDRPETQEKVEELEKYALENPTDKNISEFLNQVDYFRDNPNHLYNMQTGNTLQDTLKHADEHIKNPEDITQKAPHKVQDIAKTKNDADTHYQPPGSSGSSYSSPGIN